MSVVRLVPGLLMFAALSALPALPATAADEDYRLGAVTNQRPMLGVEMSPVPTHIQDREGLDAHQGVLVQSTYGGTAAEGMGLQRDDVILGINGQTITSMTDLRNEVGLSAVGDPIEVQITRNGQVLNLLSEVRPWPDNIPYEKLDAAAEKRFRDWQDRRQQRLADDVARLEQEADKLARRLRGEDEPGSSAAPTSAKNQDPSGFGLAFRFKYVIDATALATQVPASEVPDVDDAPPLRLPADLPSDAPWRVQAHLGTTTTL
jgi:membrane-associated protease RseP (regulator of RpoE activity)